MGLTVDLSAVERHPKPVLQFSGGKDSLACLYLLEPFWPRLTVAWANAGDAFPETYRLMEKVRGMVGGFLEVRSDVHEQNAKCGYPVDVLPLRSHPMVMMLTHPHPRPKLQAFVECCNANLWQPMAASMQEIGATLIIRGQREADVHRSPVRSGDVIEGVEYLFPIEGWSTVDVRAYLASRGVELPANYAHGDTSLDCMHCTAYLGENLGKRRYMAERHPDAYREVTRRLGDIVQAVEAEMFDVYAARAAGNPAAYVDAPATLQ